MTAITENEYTAKNKFIVMTLVVKIAVSHEDIVNHSGSSIEDLVDMLEVEYNNGDLPLSFIEENFEVTDLALTRTTYHERT